MYCRRDFVLWRFSVEGEQNFKADARFEGPFRVITHIKNDVTVRNLITDAVRVFHSNRLKTFFGSSEEAHEAALRDNDQHTIDHFITHRGDPLVRTSVDFYIKFKDGTQLWREWSKDLFDTCQYEDFCKTLPQLTPLIVLHKEAITLMRALNKTSITEIEEGLTVYLDIRAVGAGWYAGLNLPNAHFSTYIVPLIYKNFNKSDHTTINCIIPSLKIQWTGKNAVNHYFIKMWGTIRILHPDMTLLTSDMIRSYSIIEKFT